VIEPRGRNLGDECGFQVSSTWRDRIRVIVIVSLFSLAPPVTRFMRNFAR
jgi:hypothetical protein